ncbi:MAG: polyhydroxyalkanoic acid system family protein [Xanthomonadales bacterium]|jgi:putative polyhydroxyalkanoate system protein|nr:polyhydroxyalkanoic acid system family protein [Xanthomonadales bacterium]
MSSILIIHQHNCSKNEACQRAEHMLDDIANDYNLEIEHDGDGQIYFSGSGIQGEVEINQEEIHISASLGFLMLAFKPIISDKIKNKLEEIF